MATTLTASMRLTLDPVLSRDYGINGDKAIAALAMSNDIELAAAAADELFHDDGSIAQGAFPTSFQDFDLNALAAPGVVDPLGTAINLTAVMFIVVKNTTAAGGANLVFGDPTGIVANMWDGWFHPGVGAPLPPANNQFVIRPESPFIFASPAGDTIDATHKVIRLTHDGTGAAAATFEIAVVGKKV